MKLQFEVLPKIGIGPVKLGDSRSSAIEAMKVKPESFMKTPFCKYPTDSFYEAGFQVFYEGK